ncbi:MAG: hypothetical protein ACKPJJ_34755, partial [Planctomycetaceae bacterium]
MTGIPITSARDGRRRDRFLVVMREPGAGAGVVGAAFGVIGVATGCPAGCMPGWSFAVGMVLRSGRATTGTSSRVP